MLGHIGFKVKESSWFVNPAPPWLLMESYQVQGDAEPQRPFDIEGSLLYF